MAGPVRLRGLDFLFQAPPKGAHPPRAAHAARAKVRRLRAAVEKAADLSRRFKRGDPRGDAAELAWSKALEAYSKARRETDDTYGVEV